MKRTFKPHSSATPLPFGEPDRPANFHTAKVDGASRGNPGPASYAVIMRKPDGSSEFEIGKYIGRTTNNVAEYYGLIAALDYAASHGVARLRIESDSELLVRQMQGRYKVKSPDLKPLHERAQKLAHGLSFFAIGHIAREFNSEADALANLALDRTGTVGSQDAPSAAAISPAPATARREEPAEQHRQQRAAKSGELNGEKKIRARYSAGALHPLEVLDLAEGDVVEILVSKKSPA
jgi:ribonuclease HI